MAPKLPPFAALVSFAAVLVFPVGASAQNAAPPADTPYVFPTAGERARGLLFNIGGPLPVVEMAVSSGVSQARNLPPEWASSYGRRFGSAARQTAFNESAAYALAEILREDTRFQFSGPRRPAGARFAHALEQSVIDRRRNGTWVVSVPRIGGHIAGGMSALLWYPDRYTVRDGLAFAATSAAGNALVNVIREFVIRR